MGLKGSGRWLSSLGAAQLSICWSRPEKGEGESENHCLSFPSFQHLYSLRVRGSPAISPSHRKSNPAEPRGTERWPWAKRSSCLRCHLAVGVERSWTFKVPSETRVGNLSLFCPSWSPVREVSRVPLWAMSVSAERRSPSLQAPG